MIPLGADGKWISSTNGDRFGNVVRTKNLSFDRDGYVALARKGMVLYGQAADSDFTNPLAIAADNSNAFVATPDHAYQIDLASNNLAITDLFDVGGQPSLSNGSDVTFFQGTPHFTGTSTVKDYSSSVWTSRVTGLSSSYPHPLCVMEHLNSLAVGNGPAVKLYDTSYSLTTTLVLPSDYVATWIRWRLGYAFIGTRNINGGAAKVFVWNGSGASAQYGYGIQADWAYSGCEYQSGIAVITSAGQILRCSTGGFDPTPIANLPVYNSPYSWASSASTSSLIGNVASRGLGAAGDVLYFVINADLNHGQGEVKMLPEMPAGLWCFDPKVGLYHRSGFSYSQKLSLTATEAASSYLKFSTAHQAQTGDPVLCTLQSGLTGVSAGQIYYAIVDDNASTTTCRLALSPAGAYAGRNLTITGTVTTDAFAFDTYESVGASRMSTAGAVFVLGKVVPNLFYGSEVLFGGRALDSALASKGVLLSLGMGRNRGSFITAKASSTALADTFNKITAFVDGLNLATDSIHIKYRTSKRFGLPTPLTYGTTASWTSTTTFTVDATQKDCGSIQVGDELEIISGAGSGYNVHVTAISISGATHTFTVDEAMPVSSGSFDFIADNWTKWQTYTRASLADLRTGVQSGLDRVQAKWVQFKVELRGRELAIEEMQIANTKKQ